MRVIGVSHDIDYSNDGRKNSYNNLSAEEKEKVQQILFIMDSFRISEAAYHELTMTVGREKLPRSYLVKQCKNDLNSLCRITRTPGKEEGAQLDFEHNKETGTFLAVLFKQHFNASAASTNMVKVAPFVTML